MIQQPKWYKASSGDIPAAMTTTVRRIANQLSRRRADDALFLTMYGQRDIFGAGETIGVSAEDRLKFNLCRSAVNTAQAHIGSLRPKPKFLTNDGDWSLTRKAKACEQAVQGVFYANDFYHLASLAFVDACVSSLGGVKVYAHDGRVKIERTFPGEILCDVREGYYGEPQTLYQVKLVDKEALQDAYPSQRDAIQRSQAGDLSLFEWLGYDDTTDQVLVMEGWRLGQWNRSTNKFTPGKHVIAIQNAVLFQEKWERVRFPFAFYRWETRQAGFFGMGIVEELRAHQRTINYMHLRIRDMMHYISRGKLMVFDNAKINTESLTNHPMDMIKVKGGGRAPVVVNQNAVPTEWWSWRREIIEDGYRQIGFNRMQAAGEKPPGLDAAVAIREYNDVGSRRARVKVQDFEGFVVDTAQLVIEEMNAMAEAGELKSIQSTVRKGSGSALQMVDWKDNCLDEDVFRLQVSPASSLPDSTAGRTATVLDWYKAGFINVVEAKALLDMPDLEAFKSLDLAAYNNILDAIETMIEDGDYIFPEPTDDLVLLVKLTTQSLNKFKLRKAPDDRLELLRQYISDAQWLIEKSKQPAQAAAGAAGMVSAAQQALPGGASTYEAARAIELGGGAPAPAVMPAPPVQAVP